MCITDIEESYISASMITEYGNSCVVYTRRCEIIFEIKSFGATYIVNKSKNL